MEPIYPLHEEHIQKFCGNLVCIVTKEGERHVGILSGCRGGRVHLNEHAGAGAHAENQVDLTYLQGAKEKGRKSRKPSASKAAAKQVQTQALGPYPYGYGPYYPFAEAFAIELAAIAFLFLLL
ncbi:hypothetical protein [Paenibacillus humicola]|uniref:hypothetical protein n=1 Tax=Paenibacillus humicola TaxID=3110540 RepID=UPI00237ABBBD|nr:hypothetical protein [Paenibacillus humicola]